MTTVYKRLKLETTMTTTEAQNFLQQVSRDALREGHKVVRVLTTSTDAAHRVRRQIQEVRVCASGEI